MGEDNEKKETQGHENIEQVLRERDRLDQVIHEKFTQKMAVVFTDVSGYTEYMDKKGDIKGRAWMQKHNDIIFPLIESNDGKVLDVRGDGLMCSFESALSAVKACIAIQKGLEAYNSTINRDDEIHVHIGINAGSILIDKDHIAGDVVNVASRIEAIAQADQILISRSVYDEIRGSVDILCRFHGLTKVKGKAKELEIYRVVWRDDESVAEVEPRLRSSEEEVKKKVKFPASSFYLEVEQVKENIKTGASEQIVGETSTVRQYEETPVLMNKIISRCHEIVETLNRTNRQGRASRETLVKLKEIGQLFFDELITADIKEKLRATKADHLMLNIDDHMAQVPWELLHDGNEFLCQRFSMGRIVRTRQNILGSRKARSLGKPLKMLILADPKGDLKEAYEEGVQLRDFFDKEKEFINASFLSEDIHPDFIREKIRNFDLVHFAGHVDYNKDNLEESGWKLTSGIFNVREIMKMSGAAPMPSLIFSNACQSGLTETWNLKEGFQDQIFSAANAFIISGVKHYIGTFWEILDEPGRYFAQEFYKNILSNQTVGQALKASRMAVIREFGEERMTWASYLLYGDPTFNYMEYIQTDKTRIDTDQDDSGKVDIREEEIIDLATEEKKSKKRRWAFAVASVAVILLVIFGSYYGLSKRAVARYEKEIMMQYNQGNFEEALNVSRILADKEPDAGLSWLVQGDICFRQGRMDEAQSAYQKTVQSEKGTNQQKAKALMGLGRIASIQKQTDMAMDLYRRATEMYPAGSAGYLSQALIFDENGNAKGALNILSKAKEIAPDDPMLASVTNETRRKVEGLHDKERQNRVDALVNDLLQQMKSPPRALPSDNWTSSPLTLWIMDFSTQGYSLQEKEERLLAAGLTDHFLQNSRIQIVERAVLDKLLEELKLGTSALADQNAALSLGKILAARLILSGKVIYSGAQTQVSIRLIETETGRITVAANETFGGLVPAFDMAAKLSEELMDKINKTYPIRGAVLSKKDGQVVLNIGEKAGVKTGQQFKIINSDVVLEIVSTQPDKSAAKILKGNETVEKGLRVEQRGAVNGEQ